MKQGEELLVSEVAAFCGCCRDTVINYERRGLIQSLRDFNGYRQFPRREVKKLKELLSLRRPSNGAEGQS